MRSSSKRTKATTLDEFVAEQLKDKRFAKRFRETEWEYQAARAVIALRIRHGLTQDQLARRAGLPQSTIARIESMSFSPTVRTLARIARAAGDGLRIEFEPAATKRGSRSRLDLSHA